MRPYIARGVQGGGRGRRGRGGGQGRGRGKRTKAGGSCGKITGLPTVNDGASSFELVVASDSSFPQSSSTVAAVVSGAERGGRGGKDDRKAKAGGQSMGNAESPRGGVKGTVKGGKGGAAEERRRAPDGKDYAKAEFIAFYGGSAEWNTAETAVNRRGRHDSVDV